ncbi:uncharacterized protein LOC106011463 [Aplysia californica]|uniref:Uncharacterized protein LOC106011463 n=1 Tax=Aplysia californica TaxID=6500 RepID=A0ABM1VRL5_APLCA|nr:uncharacterized protein LOC106011463 [Aplysia californica]
MATAIRESGFATLDRSEVVWNLDMLQESLVGQLELDDTDQKKENQIDPLQEDKNFERILSEIDISGRKKKKKHRQKSPGSKDNRKFMFIDYTNAKVVQCGSDCFPDLYSQLVRVDGKSPVTDSTGPESQKDPTSVVAIATESEKTDDNTAAIAPESARSRDTARDSSDGGGKSRSKSRGSSREGSSKSRRRRRRKKTDGPESVEPAAYRRPCHCKHDFAVTVPMVDKETMTDIFGNTHLKSWGF